MTPLDESANAGKGSAVVRRPGYSLGSGLGWSASAATSGWPRQSVPAQKAASASAAPSRPSCSAHFVDCSRIG
jgi:hypothetical protein